MLALFLVAAPVHAFELSVEGGPASVAGKGAGQGAMVRAALGASSGESQTVQLGLQSVAWRDADGSTPARTSLSLRWQRLFPSSTAAAPMVVVGLDAGLLGRRGSDGFKSEGFALSGHLGAGVRLSLGKRLFAPMLVLATLGAGPPALATVIGLGASFD